MNRNPLAHKEINRDNPLKLTNEQQMSYDKISKENYKEFLIYGVTGSR